MPKVSICIPAYRQVAYLEKALESVIGQRYDDYEIVITDDSPDDSVQRLLERYDFSGRLRYERNQTQLGSPENWNRAVGLARGEYIKILHHDDWFVHDGALEGFVGMLDNDPTVHFAFSGSLVVDHHSGKSRRHVCDEEDFARIRSFPESLFRANVIGAPSATIYRRAAFGSGFDARLKWLVDIDFYIERIRHAPNIAMTSECLVATPTNAAHQVTEACRSRASVELFEYQYVFNKYAASLTADLASMIFLRSLFERFHVRTIADLEQLDVDLLIEPGVFEALKPRHWLIAKVMNRVYSLVRHIERVASRGAVANV